MLEETATCSSPYGRILQISPVRDSGASQTCSVDVQAPQPSLLGQGFLVVCLHRVPPSPGGVQGTAGLGAGSIFLLLREKSQDRSSSPSCQALPATTAPVPLFLFCCPHVGLWPRALSEVRGQEVSEAVPGAWGCGCSLTPSGLGQTEEPLSAEGASLGEGGQGEGTAPFILSKRFFLVLCSFEVLHLANWILQFA